MLVLLDELSITLSEVYFINFKISFRDISLLLAVSFTVLVCFIIIDIPRARALLLVWKIYCEHKEIFTPNCTRNNVITYTYLSMFFLGTITLNLPSTSHMVVFITGKLFFLFHKILLPAVWLGVWKMAS